MAQHYTSYSDIYTWYSKASGETQKVVKDYIIFIETRS